MEVTPPRLRWHFSGNGLEWLLWGSACCMLLGICTNWSVTSLKSTRNSNVASDIWAAYLTQQRTLIPTDFWISSNYEAEGTDALQDRYANKAIWIFGRLINELSELGQTARENSRSHGPYLHEFWQLWNELDAWKAGCPASVQSLIELEPSKGDVFPFILYGNVSASKTTVPREVRCMLIISMISLR